MTSKLIYIFSFIVSFLVVTVAIIYLNSKFNNIFEFDFSPPAAIQPADNNVNNQSAKDTLSTFFSKKLGDNILSKGENNQISENNINNDFLIDSLNRLKSELEKLKEKTNSVNFQQVNNTNQQVQDKEENKYQIWLKKTSALYSSMDSKKAAKIIQNYSDNIARDILYNMNKKKAAEILAEFNPETATRIMSNN